jgi:hypothetical protein
MLFIVVNMLDNLKIDPSIKFHPVSILVNILSDVTFKNVIWRRIYTSNIETI